MAVSVDKRPLVPGQARWIHRVGEEGEGALAPDELGAEAPDEINGAALNRG